MILGGYLAYSCTLVSPAGDFSRIAGMRALYMFILFKDVDSEVNAGEKAAKVGKLCLSKILFWDKKYQVTSKASKFVTTTVSNLQNKVEDEKKFKQF